MFVRAVASVVSSALLAGCSVVGVRAGTEQPKYSVVEALGEDVEVRTYGPRVAAEVTVQRTSRSANENAAFGMLAGYIFGNNTSRTEVAMTSPVETRTTSEKIAMTSPVETASSDAGMTMRFFLPADYSVDSAPTPNNASVRILDVPPETVATLRFSGLRSTANVATYKSDLMARLKNSHWQPIGEPSAYFYDPPWTVPALRRNEIVVPVERREG
jgi:hypothetical protein